MIFPQKNATDLSFLVHIWNEEILDIVFFLSKEGGGAKEAK